MVPSPHLTCLEPKYVWGLCAGEIRRLVCGGEKVGQESGTLCEPKVPPPVRDVRQAVQVPRGPNHHFRRLAKLVSSLIGMDK